MLASRAVQYSRSLLSIWLMTVLLLLVNNRIAGQKAIEDIGHFTQIGLPIAALGVSLLKNDRAGAIQLAKSVAVETVIVYSMKQLINRPRPSGGSLAFPSGHTAISFTSSTYLYKRYGWQYGVPATVLASFVGYSRFGIDEPVHWFSDVVAGAAIGVVTSLIFTTKQLDPEKISISAGLGGDTYVLGAKIYF